MDDIDYEIVMQIGVVSQSASGWTKELNLISWNGRAPKYDIRDWSADDGAAGDAGRKMSKGVTFSKEELLALRDILNRLEL